MCTPRLSQAAEVGEGVAADGEGPVRRSEGHRRNGDARFHCPIIWYRYRNCEYAGGLKDANIVVPDEYKDEHRPTTESSQRS